MKSFLKQSFGLFALIVSLGISVYLHKKTTICNEIVEMHRENMRYIVYENYFDLFLFSKYEREKEHVVLDQLKALIDEVGDKNVHAYDLAIRGRLEEFSKESDLSFSRYQSNTSVLNSILKSKQWLCVDGAVKNDLRLLVQNLVVIDTSSIELKFKLIHDFKVSEEVQVFQDSNELSEDDLKCYKGDVRMLRFELINPVTGDVQVYKKGKHE